MAGRLAAGEAILLCVGDSGAMLFRDTGEHVHSTEKHRLPPPFPQNILTDALGQSSGEPQADEYRWRLRPGDFLVMGSDGLLDSALTVQEIGRVLFASPTTSGATDTSSSGSVIEKKRRIDDAPSMMPASVSSPGIDWSAPVQTRNM